MAARRHHLELKRATRRLVEAAGGVQAAAKLIGKSRSQVQRYMYPETSSIIRADEIIILEQAAKSLIVTGVMAHIQRAAVLPLHQVHRNGNGPMSQYARGAASTVTFSERIADAAARDPDLDIADIPPLTRLLHDMLSRWSELLAGFHARMS